MPKTYTFANLGRAIEDYAKRATHRAVTHALVPEFGTNWADRGRVKSGRLTSSTVSGRGAGPHESDPGQAPGNYATDYPPRFFPEQTRRSFIDGVRGSKPLEPLHVQEAIPYAAARESIDDVVDPALRATLGNWKTTGEMAAARVRPR